MKAIIQNTIDHIDMCIESSPLSIESRIVHFEEIVAACKFIQNKLGKGFYFIDTAIAFEEQEIDPWDLIDLLGGFLGKGLKEELELIIKTIDSMIEYRRSHRQPAHSSSETPSQP